MDLATRKILDKSFSSMGAFSILLLAASLVIFLSPIVLKGCGAFVFYDTVEYRKMMYDTFNKGDKDDLEKEIKETDKLREPVFESMSKYEKDLESKTLALEKEEDALKERKREIRKKYRDDRDKKKAALEKLDEEKDAIRSRQDKIESMAARFELFKEDLRNFFGMLPGDKRPLTLHMVYGVTRWDKVEERLLYVLNEEKWIDEDGDGECERFLVPRKEVFAGTAIEEVFPYIREKHESMLKPTLTTYFGFLTDPSVDAHYFGGIWPELLGTVYLTIGAMIFTIPFGVIAAIYLCEYAKDTWFIGIIRTCISTLAGVPSIVFGLFGLAFLINFVKISPGRSVLAGSIVLALLVLPTVIRASEEAIRSVPITYKEASLSLGASRWRTIVTVILPAALPGILTGIIISMGRAAGETAPIIFTAAVSQGAALSIDQVFTNPTPALPWNIYTLASTNKDVGEIRHVQYGMVMTLVMLVVLLNAAAIFLRARISKKLKG